MSTSIISPSQPRQESRECLDVGGALSGIRESLRFSDAAVLEGDPREQISMATVVTPGGTEHARDFQVSGLGEGEHPGKFEWLWPRSYKFDCGQLDPDIQRLKARLEVDPACGELYALRVVFAI